MWGGYPGNFFFAVLRAFGARVGGGGLDFKMIKNQNLR